MTKNTPCIVIAFHVISNKPYEFCPKTLDNFDPYPGDLVVYTKK